jgi:hypothetical protein
MTCVGIGGGEGGASPQDHKSRRMSYVLGIRLDRGPGPGGPGAPEAPGRSPKYMCGACRGLRGSPGGPRDPRQHKPKNLKDWTARSGAKASETVENYTCTGPTPTPTKNNSPGVIAPRPSSILTPYPAKKGGPLCCLTRPPPSRRNKTVMQTESTTVTWAWLLVHGRHHVASRTGPLQQRV